MTVREEEEEAVEAEALDLGEGREVGDHQKAGVGSDHRNLRHLLLIRVLLIRVLLTQVHHIPRLRTQLPRIRHLQLMDGTPDHTTRLHQHTLALAIEQFPIRTAPLLTPQAIQIHRVTTVAQAILHRTQIIIIEVIVPVTILTHRRMDPLSEAEGWAATLTSAIIIMEGRDQVVDRPS